MASMIRTHQLTGPNNKRVTWNPGVTVQYQYTDLPNKSVICGKKYVSAVLGTKLTYEVALVAGMGDVVITRDDLNQILISQIQIDGTAMGTIVSAANMKPGILDTHDFISNGGRMMGNAYNTFILPATTGRQFRHTVFIPFGFYGCKSPMSMAPLTAMIRQANIKIDAPTTTTFSTGLGLASVTAVVTASAIMLWRDELVIPPGYQMTRFKSTAAGAGVPTTDSVDLRSFGQNSTLTGVEQRSAIAALLWGSDSITGDGTGAGPVASITDTSALFAGIEQTNDLDPIIDLMRTEYDREAPDMQTEFGIPVAPLATRYKYPLFTVEKPITVPRFFPIFPSRRGEHISKMPIADGSPSYQLTFTPVNTDHYTYLWGLYRWQEAQFAAMLDIVKRDDLGIYLYGSNDLTDLAKLNKKQDGADVNFSKATFLPRKLLPQSMVK